MNMLLKAIMAASVLLHSASVPSQPPPPTRPANSDRMSEAAQRLYDGCNSGDMKKVEEALDRGVDVNTVFPGSAGVTPIYVAAFHDNTVLVSYLLKRRADPNLKTRSGRTALDMAAFADKTDTLVLLIEKGADVNAKGPRGGALHVAALAGKKDAVKILLERGADVKAVNDWGETPLHRAAEALADPGPNGWKREIAEQILKHGGSVDARTRVGDTPLMYAAMSGNAPVAELLLKNGASVTTKDDRGQTPLSFAQQATTRPSVRSEDATAISEMLTRAGAK